MDRKWTEEKNRKMEEGFRREKERICQTVRERLDLDEDIRKEWLGEIRKLKRTVHHYQLLALKTRFQMDLFVHAKITEMDGYHLLDLNHWLDSLELEQLGKYAKDYSSYADSEPKEFNGDLIITDPCYIMRAKHHGTVPVTEDDWEASAYGTNLETLGIHTYLTRDTIYGDWSCTTFDDQTGEPIGQFCADAGMVSVIDLQEVLSYNPDFTWHQTKPFTTTWIKDFQGKVWFEVVDSSEKNNEDYEVHVRGEGIHKSTGKSFSFYTTQSGC